MSRRALSSCRCERRGATALLTPSCPRFASAAPRRPKKAGGARGYGGGGYGPNKRKGSRPGAGGDDDYRAPGGSGRFGGPLDREMQFFEKVKARLRNRELYQDFLKCLNLYAQEIISRQELLNLAHVSSPGRRVCVCGSSCAGLGGVAAGWCRAPHLLRPAGRRAAAAPPLRSLTLPLALVQAPPLARSPTSRQHPQDIIGRFPDLLDGFNRFLARCETMDAVDSEMRAQFGGGKISAKDIARLKGQTIR